MKSTTTILMFEAAAKLNEGETVLIRWFCIASLAFAGWVAGCSVDSNRSERLVPLPPKDTIDVDEKVDAVEVIGPKVDILFVIDNSGSMSTHQQNLMQNIWLFVNEMKNTVILDYRIGVTTTDANWGGELIGDPAYVEKSTPDGDFLLRKRMDVGTGGYYMEQMFNPVYKALTPPLTDRKNKDFLRPDAFFATVFITDAEDQSQNTHPYMDGPGLFQFISNLKGSPNKYIAYGAIVPSTAPSNCPRDETRVYPYRLEEFFKLTKGKFFSLCSSDFGRNLAALGEDLVERVGRTILLKTLPKDPARITVRYGTQVIPNDYRAGWYYVEDLNAISFGEELVLSEQPDGTQFEIRYEAVKF